MLKRIIRSFLFVVTGIIAGLFALNAAIIFFAQPANIQAGEKVEIATQHGSVSIVLLDELRAGGLGNLASGTTGYVNVLSADKVIYLDGSQFDKAPMQNTYIYRHELAHVLQKELIAEKVGGYPSIGNPIVSFAYYAKLIQMNNDFSSLMPQDAHDAREHPLFSGLETAADCFAQREKEPVPLTYIGSTVCTPEQQKIALALLSARWPAPLDDEENAALNGKRQETPVPSRSFGRP